ncbi:MAG: gamma-glutamylcyclotransferase [Paracoccaceae bacterium]|nr:gamma-glutamylcyclotransferase [Paracoccaceae bacterium]
MWVFGYGSLLWNPGFVFTKTKLVRLDGFRRSFCMSSIHHRGTSENPGLVLALDSAEGFSCNGVAFHVEEAEIQATLDYLRERELISSAYLEAEVKVHGQDGSQFMAITYIIDKTHEQYCVDLALAEQANIIANAVGGMGHNADYLFNTVSHLKKLDLTDPELDWLETQVHEILDAKKST